MYLLKAAGLHRVSFHRSTPLHFPPIAREFLESVTLKLPDYFSHEIAQCVSSMGELANAQCRVSLTEMKTAQCRNAADLNEFIEYHVGIREVLYSGVHSFTTVLQYSLR